MGISRKSFWLRAIGIFLAILSLILIGGYIYLQSLLDVTYKGEVSADMAMKTRVQVDDSTWAVGNNYLREITPGNYIMYIEGSPLERGHAIGALTKELHKIQEDAFVSQIRKMIPNEGWLRFLKYFIAVFNKDIENYIPDEYLAEIYGESLFMSSEYDDMIGSPYMRILNYHAAHDIGHALQDKNLVAGCTSFALWDTMTSDKEMIVGRNFDFYVGDDFAKNKIVAFFRPTDGFPFAMVTWPGMIGAVSGMNQEGITVTINAAKSSMPTGARTPISILARRILQYSPNLETAEKIAREMSLFVSESILVTSGKENNAIIIEKTPDKMDVFRSSNSAIICPNHFQSPTFVNDEINKNNMALSSSLYRFHRVQQLIDREDLLTPEGAARILRNPYGMDDKQIGWGNEKAVNQLIAHHGIIAKPASREMWVSTSSFQLGEMVYYNLNDFFATNEFHWVASKNIPVDTHLIHTAYEPYKEFKSKVHAIHESINSKSFDARNESIIDTMISLNPEYFWGYEVAGDYFEAKNDVEKALFYYNKSIQLEIPTNAEFKRVENKINKIQFYQK